mmetsp:Transcript_10535/g.23215  ORF Transcript_10535/g.23215 Transcript_10535/m.23215 type:complete len:292 (-) Transcript_10535:353-1228(-)
MGHNAGPILPHQLAHQSLLVVGVKPPRPENEDVDGAPGYSDHFQSGPPRNSINRKCPHGLGLSTKGLQRRAHVHPSLHLLYRDRQPLPRRPASRPPRRLRAVQILPVVPPLLPPRLAALPAPVAPAVPVVPAPGGLGPPAIPGLAAGRDGLGPAGRLGPGPEPSGAVAFLDAITETDQGVSGVSAGLGVKFLDDFRPGAVTQGIEELDGLRVEFPILRKALYQHLRRCRPSGRPPDRRPAGPALGSSFFSFLIPQDAVSCEVNESPEADDSGWASRSVVLEHCADHFFLVV